MDLLSVDLTLKCRDAREILAIADCSTVRWSYRRSAIVTCTALVRGLVCSDLGHDVLVAQRAFEILKHRLLLIRLNHEFLDVFREHGQPLIFLRVGEPSVELDVLRIDDQGLLLAARPATTCVDRTARCTLCLCLFLSHLLDSLGVPVQVSRAQHFELLGRDLCPRVSQDVLGGQPSLWLLVEELLEEDARRVRDVVGDRQLLLPNVVVELLVVLAAERELAAQEGEQKHAKGPDVGRRTRVLDLADDLGRHVGGRAAEDLHFALVRDASAEAEVDQLHSLSGLIKQDVLQLDVSVRDVALVAVGDGLDDLAPEELGLELGHLPIGLHLEVPVQAATVDVLHYQEHLLVRLEGFVELRDVRVIEPLHDLHLALDRLAPVGLHQLDLLVDLDGDLLVEHLVQPESHHCVRALADALANEIVVEVLDRAVLGVEFDHFLVRLALRLVDLRFVQWMSIEHVPSLIVILRNATTGGTRVLRNSMVWSMMHDSMLDLRSLHYYRLCLSFFLIVDKSSFVVDALQLRHVLGSIELIRVDEIEFPRDAPFGADLLRVCRSFFLPLHNVLLLD